MALKLTRYEALCLCVERAETQQKFADALGVTQAAVSLWVNRTKQLPGEYVLRAAELYDVTPQELRPDLYPADLGARFYGTAIISDEPELPLADEERVIEIDRRASNDSDRFQGVDRRAQRARA